MDIAALADLVKQLRIDRGLTQRELSDEAGYTTEVISRIEQARSMWSNSAAVAFAKALAKHHKLSATQALAFFKNSGMTPPEAKKLPDALFVRLLDMKIIDGPHMTTDGPVGEIFGTMPPVRADVNALDLAAAHTLLDRVLYAIGSRPTRELLSAILAACQAAPAASEQSSAPSGPRAVILPPVAYPDEGREVHEIVPIKQPPSPAQKSAPAKPKHRRA